MNELDQARKTISEIDGEMAALFLRRMAAAEQVAAYKQAHGLPVLDPVREQALLDRSRELVPEGSLRGPYLSFQKQVMALSRAYQHRLLEGMRVAYSGVEGAYAQIAAERIFPQTRLEAYPSFETAYEAVVRGDCHCAVLPVENSYAGEVGQVMDLAFRGELQVSGMYDLQVEHCLLGVPGAALEDIVRVTSHPQALQQCEPYLRRRGYATEAASNTAVAAELVARAGDRRVAAIASAATAERFGLTVLDHDINENKSNTTRFAVFTPEGPGDGGDAFLLFFTVKNAAGALAEAISVVGRHGFNMRALRSRPRKTLPWKYYFYAEVEGDLSAPEGAALLEDLRSRCDLLKVAGRWTVREVCL